MKAMRSRWALFILAWILKTKAEKSGEKASIAAASCSFPARGTAGRLPPPRSAWTTPRRRNLSADFEDKGGEVRGEGVNLPAGDFDMEAVRAGKLSPVFFGSALTNFGVEPFLEEFLCRRWRTSPGQTRR